MNVLNEFQEINYIKEKSLNEGFYSIKDRAHYLNLICKFKMIDN